VLPPKRVTTLVTLKFLQRSKGEAIAPLLLARLIQWQWGGVRVSLFDTHRRDQERYTKEKSFLKKFIDKRFSFFRNGAIQSFQG